MHSAREGRLRCAVLTVTSALPLHWKSQTQTQTQKARNIVFRALVNRLIQRFVTLV